MFTVSTLKACFIIHFMKVLEEIIFWPDIYAASTGKSRKRKPFEPRNLSEFQNAVQIKFIFGNLLKGTRNSQFLVFPTK